MSNKERTASGVEKWKEDRAKATPSLKFKQHSKKITPKGKGFNRLPYLATYEHFAIPETAKSIIIAPSL